jgi:hypothetical protein
LRNDRFAPEAVIDVAFGAAMKDADTPAEIPLDILRRKITKNRF